MNYTRPQLAVALLVDNNAQFLFAPAHKVIEVAKEQQAIPFDIPNVELGHHGEEECSFDTIIKKYELDKRDPALLELAKIVRGAVLLIGV